MHAAANADESANVTAHANAATAPAATARATSHHAGAGMRQELQAAQTRRAHVDAANAGVTGGGVGAIGAVVVGGVGGVGAAVRVAVHDTAGGAAGAGAGAENEGGGLDEDETVVGNAAGAPHAAAGGAPAASAVQ